MRVTAIVCDFDGTITNIDTSEFVLTNFAAGNWRIFDEKLDRMEITLEDCMNRQFGMVRGSKQAILDKVEKAGNIQFRRGFQSFVTYCQSQNVKLIVASAGLDFCIQRLFRLNGLVDSSIPIHAPKAICTENNGITFTFPKLCHPKQSVNHKDDIVRSLQESGKQVMYIGDAPPDYPAAKVADITLAIRGSSLAKLCRNDGVSCLEIDDFEQAIKILEKTRD